MDSKAEIEEILKLKEEQPYLVILGAGATMAAIPDGDINHKRSSTMKGFLKKLGMENILDGIELNYKGDNLEDIYSELHEKPQYNDIVHKIEIAIYNYFSDMELPFDMTIYDYLVISLTNKDCIASFNWDPLLLQAYNRMRELTDNLPELLFLHGNVAAGICTECKRYGPIKNKVCPKCGKPFKPVPLLYPVKQKNYNDDIFIKDQWLVFEDFCKRSGLITFFGYSAPKSDIEARERILKAYTSSDKRLDSIEIIDLRSNDSEFQDNWSDFSASTNYHANFYTTFWDSILAEYPRNEAKGYVKRFLRGSWNGSDISLTPGMDNYDLYTTLKSLL